MPDNNPSVYRFAVVLGGGGHAAVLIETLRVAGQDIAKAVLDLDPDLWGTDILGVPILGDERQFPRLILEGADCFVTGVGSTGNNEPRRRVFASGIEHGLPPLTILHPTAYIAPSAQLGAGCQILPRAIVHTRARLGVNVLVNTGAIVEHDCVVGDHTHIATGAQLAGGVIVGEAAHIGAGATIRQGIRIGANALVGAGAVVVRDVPDGWVVAGVPARELKRNPV
jgi:UDP-perosamine 4-acetyltransferase